MKQKFGKVSLLFLALVLALAGVGAAFSAWTDTLTISGTIDTGIVKVGFWELILTERPEVEGKDVGRITGQMEDQIGLKYNPLTGQMEPVFDDIVFTIDNAYPGYIGQVTFVVTNIGTIPVKINSFNLSDPTSELNFVWVVPPPASPAYGYAWKDFNGNGIYDEGEKVMTFQLQYIVSHQLEPCQSIKTEFDLILEQPAEQLHTYKIVATIEAIQWNKYGETNGITG